MNVSGVKLDADHVKWLRAQFAANKRGRPARESLQREILKAVADALPVSDEQP